MSDKPIIVKVDEVAPADVPRSPGATIQVLLGEKEGMAKIHTRIFTLTPGTVIAEHGHDTIPHEQVMLEGKMKITVGKDEFIVEPGNVIHLPAGIPHSYENIGDTPVRFVCSIPCDAPYTTDFTEDSC